MGGGIYITYCVYNMYMKEKLSGSDAWRCSSSSNDGIFYNVKKKTSPRIHLLMTSILMTTINKSKEFETPYFY